MEDRSWKLGWAKSGRSQHLKAENRNRTRIGSNIKDVLNFKPHQFSLPSGLCSLSSSLSLPTADWDRVALLGWEMEDRRWEIGEDFGFRILNFGVGIGKTAVPSPSPSPFQFSAFNFQLFQS